MHTPTMMIAQLLSAVIAIYATRYVKSLISSRKKTENAE